MDAYDTDVRPLLAELRAGLGLDPDPMAAYARSGYGERIVAERVGGQPGGLGRMSIAARVARPASCIDRSNRLGADPRNTNYAGGNTSAKGTAIDPVDRASPSSCCGSRARAATSGR